MTSWGAAFVPLMNVGCPRVVTGVAWGFGSARISTLGASSVNMPPQASPFEVKRWTAPAFAALPSALHLSQNMSSCSCPG
jgi:hypothetical protein